MKVAILYRSNSETERQVIEFESDYYRLSGRHISMYDVNSREGWEMAKLYDIVQYPAFIAMEDDGKMLQLWQGEKLPLINEVMYYSKSF
jgi:hypothetical protein